MEKANTVLVVDDSKIVRKIARKIFENLGFTVSDAEHGQDALNQCNATAPDIILLDWNMPVMDGMEFLKALRAAPITPQPKVIFCTTEHEFSRIQAAMEAGADEFIMKPFDEEIIRDKLLQLQLLDE